MQRIPQGMVPPRVRQNEGEDKSASPAYIMAARIRAEQGREKAGEYLAAMEPFLAPGERAHIAARLGLPSMPKPAPQQYAAPQQSYAPQNQQSRGQSAGPAGDPMQLMSMLSGLGAMGGKGGGRGGMDPMSLVQLLGGMMKK